MVPSLRSLLVGLARPAMIVAHRVRRWYWTATGASLRGVLGVVVTPEGRIVLVRHTYTPGWHCPGGGYRADEDPAAAVAREMREEIGLCDGTLPKALPPLHDEIYGRENSLALFVVREARYVVPFSLEIAEVRAFDPAALPSDLGRLSRVALARALDGRG